MAKIVDTRSLPVLKGWVALPPAALAMRVTRQRAFQMIEEGKITTVHRVLGESEEARPAAYLVRVAEVLELAVANCPDCQALIREYRETYPGESPEDARRDAAPYCVHWQFPEQDVVFDATEPVEHVTPGVMAEPAAAQ